MILPCSISCRLALIFKLTSPSLYSGSYWFFFSSLGFPLSSICILSCLASPLRRSPPETSPHRVMRWTAPQLKDRQLHRENFETQKLPLPADPAAEEGASPFLPLIDRPSVTIHSSQNSQPGISLPTVPPPLAERVSTMTAAATLLARLAPALVPVLAPPPQPAGQRRTTASRLLPLGPPSTGSRDSGLVCR